MASGMISSMLAALRSRLWVRLVGLFVLASVVPLLGAGWITARLLEERARTDATDQLQSLADLGASLVHGFVERGRTKLITVGRLLGEEIAQGQTEDKAEDGALRTFAMTSLNRMVEPADLFLELHYYAASPGKGARQVVNVGTQELQLAQQSIPDLAAQQFALGNENVATSIVRKPLLEGRPLVAPAVVDHFGFPSVQLSAPVPSSPAGDGAVVAYVDLRLLEDLLSPLAHGDRGVALRDANGADMLALAADADTAPSFDAAQPVGDLGWTVHITEPTASVFAAAGALRTQVTTWTGLAALLAVLLSIGCAAWLVRPVRTLTRAAQKMQGGDLTARARIARHDEIGRLGHAFDDMADALQQLDAARASFVGTVSHELRTPLTSIRMSLGNVLDGLLGDLDPRQRTSLERMRGDVERLDRVVRDTLALARLEAGAEDPRLEQTDLSTVARDAVGVIQPLAEREGVRVVVTGQGQALADSDLLRRVFVNLLDNAVKFSPRGGTVTVALDGATFRISDEGDGFAVEKPFDAFAQGARDGVKNPGVGLGLAIVAQLVALHRGQVAVEAGPGGCVAVQLQPA